MSKRRYEATREQRTRSSESAGHECDSPVSKSGARRRGVWSEGAFHRDPTVRLDRGTVLCRERAHVRTHETHRGKMQHQSQTVLMRSATESASRTVLPRLMHGTHGANSVGTFTRGGGGMSLHVYRHEKWTGGRGREVRHEADARDPSQSPTRHYKPIFLLDSVRRQRVPIIHVNVRRSNG
jgi:hypothetical protein